MEKKIYKRKAILVAAGGSKAKKGYLPGAKQDLMHMFNFLMSNEGGGWKPDEVELLVNCTGIDVLHSIHKASNMDYLMLYYTGHGRNSNVNGSILSLSESDEIFVDDFKSKSVPKQLIIIDSCRSMNVPHEMDTMKESYKIRIPDFPNTKLSEIEKVFYDYLEGCEDGVVRCFSTSIGQDSNDSKYGGLFSLPLVLGTQEWIKNKNIPGVIPIQVAFGLAKKQFTNFEIKDQLPTIETSHDGHLYFPFAINLPIAKDN